jgi:hypothetical protein
MLGFKGGDGPTNWLSFKDLEELETFISSAQELIQVHKSTEVE